MSLEGLDEGLGDASSSSQVIGTVLDAAGWDSVFMRVSSMRFRACPMNQVPVSTGIQEHLICNDPI